MSKTRSRSIQRRSLAPGATPGAAPGATLSVTSLRETTDCINEIANLLLHFLHDLM